MKRRRLARLLAAAAFAMACPWAFAGDAGFDAEIAQARRAAEAGNPAEALEGFDRALRASRTSAERSVALSGCGAMRLWLGDYERALDDYSRMLSVAPDEDALAAARAGRARALVNLDRPREASAGIPPDARFTPELAIVAAQAALNAGHGVEAQALLDGDREALDALSPGSHLARERDETRRQVRAERADPVTLRADYASDSDGFSSRSVRLDAGHFSTPDARIDVLAATTRYRQDDWREDATSVGAGIALRMSDFLSGTATAGRTRFTGWSPATGAASVVLAPDDRWRLEAFYEREPVETQAAFAAHLVHSTWGAALDYVAAPRLTLVGAVFAQDFSDGNHRDGAKARATITASAAQGFALEWRGRTFHDKLPGPRGYFNPADFGEMALLLKWSGRLESGWRVHAFAGPGIERADGVHRGTSFAEVRVERFLASCLKAQAALGHTTSSGSSDSGFNRSYGWAWLSCAW